MSYRFAFRGALAVVAALLLSTAADAQLFRAYLAPGPAGNDANNCTLAAPCRLLPAALAAVADGGEIWMLDSANYNTATVTIGKSVSILAVPGAVGSVVAVAGPAISITASNLKVALRNLVIVPIAGGGGDGIDLTGASALTIEDSLIANLPTHGVYVLGAGTVKITNSTIRNSGLYGVKAQDGAHVTIERTNFLNNFEAILAQGTTASTTTVSMSDSIASGGAGGVEVYTSAAAANARISLTRCTVEGNTNGILASTNAGAGSALMSVSGSMIINNLTAWYIAFPGAVIKTLGNNHILDNGAGNGSLTTASLM